MRGSHRSPRWLPRASYFLALAEASTTPWRTTGSGPSGLQRERGQAGIGTATQQEALNAWARADSSTEAAALRKTFEVLVQHVYRHLRSGRSLSTDADTMLQRERDQEEMRSRSSDRGPEYLWPLEYESLKQQLAAVFKWLKARAKEDSSGATADDTSPEAQEARARLDAMLCDLMVQRSRSRALKLTAVTEGADIDRMFRKPRVPRYPLALNEPDHDGHSFEARILSQLYELLGADADGEGLRAGQLDLFAYRLGVLRARLRFGQTSGGTGAQVEQTVRNNLGFQRVNLVKRLQSSPYAFLRTVLRGPLRRTLYEIGLVERLLAPLGGAFDAWAGGTAPRLEAHPLADQFLAVRASLASIRSEVRLGLSTRLDALAEILDGVRHSDELFFCELGGLFSLGAAAKLTDRVTRQRFDRDFGALLEALGLDDNGGGGFSVHLYEASWASCLIDDLAGHPSRLFHDLAVALDWTFSAGSDGLVGELYKGLEHANLDGQDLDARPYGVLRSAFLAMPMERSGDVRPVLDWLTHRLGSDSRLRATVGWIVLQRAVAVEAGGRVTPWLSGGSRSLIFSEYTDTQEYVLAALAALVRCFSCSHLVDLTGLARLVAQEAVEVAARLDQSSSLVRSTESSGAAEADYQGYRSPVDPGAVEVAGLLRRLEGGQGADTLRSAVLSLESRVARVCSSSAGRPLSTDGALGSAVAVFDDDEVASGEAGEDANTSIATGAVIEAFSPWYQIAPPKSPQSRASGFRRRLEAAARAPVDVMFATEVLSEGVNLQECGVVIHYDLPWNPTRLIQRNGRIDRRISQLYEDEAERAALIAVLSMDGGSEEPVTWRPPAFTPPQQVFHMTLLPVEPDDVALGSRVRACLFQKLDTIRGLFGLSYWPVVLDQETARRVLTGELEYETPGFRRREELFRHWSALRVLAESGTSREDAHGRAVEEHAVTIRLPSAFRQRLASQVTGSPEQTSQWSSLLCAGIVGWTPYIPNVMPVRSAPEANALLGRSPPVGALNGVLLVDDDGADGLEGGYRAIVWALEHGATGTLSPALVSVNPARLGEADLSTRFRWGRADLTTLAPATSGTEIDLRHPSSGTGMAEELLTAFVSYALTDPEGVSQVASSSGHGAAREASMAGCADLVERRPPWLLYLNWPISRGALPVGRLKKIKFGDQPLVQDPPLAPGPLKNFWFVFDA